MTSALEQRSGAQVPGALAAIDIGTNSVHMLIARVAGNGRFEVVTRQKEMVRLHVLVLLCAAPCDQRARA